ncbi:D-alanyl-lipoteichoic acid acyltransferase DltB (MBOAT superfamily) [Rhodoblastus sphagnicola]|uniref:MBOAT family O-acyltransferase n=1 Tax=Rhodoblastus sphagnicola TaxID=333368 RepID=UPI00182F2380|nr:MBOAT family protein [Rhodoblastus sphagnicola]MBB4196230.1 D-alanyl-lipoteichoic acid acyltransferase DltB (MBOAT superfamily) [Rhodoblastus sphagnicola]
MPLTFYAWWDVRLVGLLLASILTNYAVGVRIAGAREGAPGRARVWLIAGIALNLGCLLYFKYMNWLIDTFNLLAGVHLDVAKIVLPLGISFYTFTQIAFLVDSFSGKVKERNFPNYLLFVTYFPHLIAGPVLHHAEMMPQFADPSNKRVSLENVAFGLALFLIGAIKKVGLADSVAPIADQIFDGAGPLNAVEAWRGALGYTVQIYFDFSGYTDMALGISRLFNINLPLNFNSPYQSRSIVEFWRRWHMSLSRFLRDYLYIALGGNRKGPVRRYLNLFATMALGGLWHGAGWTFLIWGALHGAYLIVDHAIRALARALGVAWRAWMAPFTQAATLLAVVVGWVFFRATSLDGALRVLHGMVRFDAPPGDGVVREVPQALFGALAGSDWAWIAALLALTLFAPNSQRIIGWAERLRAPPWPGARLAPLAFTGFATTLLLFVVSLSGMRHGVSPFIYFNF